MKPQTSPVFVLENKVIITGYGSEVEFTFLRKFETLKAILSLLNTSGGGECMVCRYNGT